LRFKKKRERKGRTIVQVHPVVSELVRQAATEMPEVKSGGVRVKNEESSWHPAATGGMLVSTFKLEGCDSKKGAKAVTKEGMGTMFPRQQVRCSGKKKAA
jgi:hypothetical protein